MSEQREPGGACGGGVAGGGEAISTIWVMGADTDSTVAPTSSAIWVTALVVRSAETAAAVVASPGLSLASTLTEAPRIDSEMSASGTPVSTESL